MTPKNQKNITQKQVFQYMRFQHHAFSFKKEAVLLYLKFERLS